METTRISAPRVFWTTPKRITVEKGPPRGNGSGDSWVLVIRVPFRDVAEAQEAHQDVLRRRAVGQEVAVIELCPDHVEVA